MFYICLSRSSLCRRPNLPKMCTLFCLVHIKKRSFVTSCVLLFVSLNASSHLCFRFFGKTNLSKIRKELPFLQQESVKHIWTEGYIRSIDVLFSDQFMINRPQGPTLLLYFSARTLKLDLFFLLKIIRILID